MKREDVENAIIWLFGLAAICLFLKALYDGWNAGYHGLAILSSTVILLVFALVLVVGINAHRVRKQEEKSMDESGRLLHQKKVLLDVRRQAVEDKDWELVQITEETMRKLDQKRQWTPEGYLRKR